MDPSIISAQTDEEKADVDKIVRNNSQEENDAIIKELKIVKASILKIRELRKKFVIEKNMPIEKFKEHISGTFNVIKEKYETLFDMSVKKDDVGIILRMVDAQIAVAEKKASFKDLSQQFGKELHNKSVEPLLEMKNCSKQELNTIKSSMERINEKLVSLSSKLDNNATFRENTANENKLFSKKCPLLFKAYVTGSVENRDMFYKKLTEYSETK